MNNVGMNGVLQSRRLYNLLGLELWSPELTYCLLTLALRLYSPQHSHSAAAQRLPAAKRTVGRGRPIVDNIYEWVKHLQYRTGIENAMSLGRYCSHS